MAKKTTYLSLILPALGEFFNKWDKPTNDNFQKIDDFANELGSEIEAARGGSATLGDRLDESLNPDGSLKDVPEVAEARSSKVHGSGAGAVFFTLDQRLEENDLEVMYARQGREKLVDGMAWAGDFTTHNCLISGPTNPLTFSGATVTLNGGTTPVIANINGYRAVVDTNDQSIISGAAGTYHIYIDRQPNGKTIYTHPASVGQTGLILSTNKLSKYTATGTNLIASGIKVGDILELTAPGGNLNLGRWIVKETAVENPVDLTNSEVHIIGEFASSSTGLSGTFIRQQAPILSTTNTAPSPLWQSVADRIYIGRCVFDGANITSLISYPYQARHETWQAVTLLGGDFNYAISHNLGYIPKRVHVYASQANDFSQPLELMSITKMTQGSASLTAGDQSISYTPPALRRSVVVRMTDTVLDIKNATNGIFYEDFSGTPQTSGYLYIVIER